MGEEARIPRLILEARLAFQLNNLKDYRVTSPRCTQYNCVAWALSDQTHWHQSGVSADPEVAYFWPDGLPNEDTLESWIALFNLNGFTQCSHGNLERGVAKIAIYADTDGVTHVARQLASGWWASKLGKNVDIEHRSCEELEGDYYGRIVMFMGRMAVDAAERGTHE